jgi:hypothetical protein
MAYNVRGLCSTETYPMTLIEIVGINENLAIKEASKNL